MTIAFVVAYCRSFRQLNHPSVVSFLLFDQNSYPSFFLSVFPVSMRTAICHSLHRCLTLHVDSMDDRLWDSVPNIHKAGSVNDEVSPTGHLQHTGIVCDVPLCHHHLYLA